MVICTEGGLKRMDEKKDHDDEMEDLFKKFSDDLKEVEQKFSDIEQNIAQIRKEKNPDEN